MDHDQALRTLLGVILLTMVNKNNDTTEEEDAQPDEEQDLGLDETVDDVTDRVGESADDFIDDVSDTLDRTEDEIDQAAAVAEDEIEGFVFNISQRKANPDLDLDATLSSIYNELEEFGVDVDSFLGDELEQYVDDLLVAKRQEVKARQRQRSPRTTRSDSQTQRIAKEAMEQTQQQGRQQSRNVSR